MSLDLSLYAEDLETNKVQHIVVNEGLQVLKSSDTIILFKELETISDRFPFFFTIEELLHIKDRHTYTFSCIHFTQEEETTICDITLKTFKDKDALIIIQDLTSHYNDYQSTSQERNVSVINKEKLDIQHLLLKSQENFKNKFIANFSHTLRDPLSNIISFGEFLESTELDYQQKNYLNLIQSSSIYLKQIIDDILLLSKLQTKQVKLTNTIFNLKDFLEEISQTYQLEAIKKGLKFNYNVDTKTDLLVVADTIKLRQILTVLLYNAVQYTSKGSIDLKVSCNQKRARKQSITFEISDTGPGIEKERINTIFHSFSKKQNTEKHHNSGFGLGLSIASELVHLFKGKIEVDSLIDKGSTFTVNLNLKLEDKKPKKIIKEDEDIEDLLNSLQDREPTKILLIDDSEMMQMTLFKLCSTIKNIDLDILTDTEDLLDTIEITEYALILINTAVEDSKGIDLTKKIRTHRHRTLKRTPIIAIAGDVFQKDLKAYDKAGINFTLKKPFTKQELFQAILNQL